MHLDKNPLDFGPSAGQNGDFYKRQIYEMQETNFNNKFGKIEEVMLRTYCQTANLKALLLDNLDV
jgi:hypothetical protein